MDAARRKPRADAAENRMRLIEAAKVILGRGGPEASLEAVARRAGVGIGTLYRHFPTRETLFHAVYRHEVEQLIALAAAFETRADPAAALRAWVHAFVGLVATKRGLLDAMSLAITDESRAVFAELSGRLTDALRRLLGRGIAAGDLRADVGPDDILQTTVAFCYGLKNEPGWQDQALRLLDIFLDGLRPRRPAARRSVT